MPIQTSDLHLRLSAPSASSGNSVAQGNPNASLGKYVSQTDVTSGSNDNIYDDVSGDENAAGTIDYRCLFAYNAHGSLTLQGAKVWLSGVRATVAASTDKFTANSHGYVNGDVVRIEAELNTDTMPGGVNNSTTYYVVSASANDFKLSLTLGGSAIDITSDGTVAVRQYGNTTVALAIDNTAASAVGASAQQADTITNETTAPTGVGSFSSPTTKAAGLSLGDIPAGQCRAFWLKRTALNVGARANDGTFPNFTGDTAA